MKGIITLSALLFLLSSCKGDTEERPVTINNQVMVISHNAPENKRHYLSQDTVGKLLIDSLGPYSYHSNHGFSYMDRTYLVQTWAPKPEADDTIIISTSRPYLELSFPNPYLKSPQSFLVQKGDTIEFSYEYGIPIAALSNLSSDKAALNYDRERLRNIYADSYSPYHLILQTLLSKELGMSVAERHNRAFRKSQQFYQQEITYIDSLLEIGVLDTIQHLHRRTILTSTQWQNAQFPGIKKNLLGAAIPEEINDIYLSSELSYDLQKSDSLLAYHHFRDYLNKMIRYGLPVIHVNYFGEAGGSFIDNRQQFDSILVDERFDQQVKRFLLPLSLRGIMTNYPLDDQKKYMAKLEQALGSEFATKMKRKLEIPDTFSQALSLIQSSGITTTFEELIQSKADSVIFINFWASWCRPCIENIDNYKDLKKSMSNEKVAFLELAIYDKYEPWKKMINKHGLTESSSYFAPNSKFSYKLQELDIATIPRYMIFDTEGNVAASKASKNSEAARRQLVGILH